MNWETLYCPKRSCSYYGLPFGQGWLFVLKVDNPDDLKNLKDSAAYKKQIGG